MGARPVIALADPLPDEAEMYAASLWHEGFDVRIITTSDAAAAATEIHDIVPDAVLTRILPRRFGIDLVIQLRRDPLLADRPVLVITSLTYHEAELRDARAAGATEVLLLPQTAEDLAHLIRGYLRRAPRRLRRA
jgi:DNA-binding response OmpR family regulator